MDADPPGPGAHGLSKSLSPSECRPPSAREMTHPDDGCATSVHDAKCCLDALSL